MLFEWESFGVRGFFVASIWWPLVVLHFKAVVVAACSVSDESQCCESLGRKYISTWAHTVLNLKQS